jgi:hypothetical protein
MPNHVIVLAHHGELSQWGGFSEYVTQKRVKILTYLHAKPQIQAAAILNGFPLLKVQQQDTQQDAHSVHAIHIVGVC